MTGAITSTAPSREALFSAHAPYVWRVVRYLGVAEREVEDVAQEVFLRAFEKLESYDDARGAIRTWLYGFCVGVVANHRRLRRHQREVLGEDADTRLGDGVDQETAVAAKETRVQLLVALDALSEDHRTLTVLHAIEELPMPEVARLLGIPVQTAYSRYQVARAELRRALERAGKPRRSS